jgi:type II secretory ATPase GspE/PulE/Tfp pilus assembly ATPase PilB-like protein
MLTMTARKTTLDEMSTRLAFSQRFKKLANAIHAAPDFRTVLTGMPEQIAGLYNAQMVTMYLIDRDNREIYSLAITANDQLKEIRMPISGNSIAGYVAQTCKPVNIRNVHDRLELVGIDADLAFDSAWDKKSGMTTRQVLAAPVLFQGKHLGVIQLVNKRSGSTFTTEDMQCLFDLAETLGIAFHNLHRAAGRKPTRYDMLIKNGIIAEHDLSQAQTMARKQHRDVETVLRHEFKVAPEDLGHALAQFYRKPFIDLRHAPYDPGPLIRGINIDYFRKARCIPLTATKGRTVFAVDDPTDQVKIQEIMRVLRVNNGEFRVALREDIENFITLQQSMAKHRREEGSEKSLADILADMRDREEEVVTVEEERGEGDADDRAIVLLVRKIIEDAYRQRASDIHLEPYGSKKDAEVRFRIDGRCVRFLTIPKKHIKAVVSRFKILSQLDISERRKPQDGKIKFSLGGDREIELRVSTIPTAEGNEDVVLRLLNTAEPLPLERIMPPNVFKSFSSMVRKPHGIILVVGPTGSGKTTTLHSALAHINTPDRKIWTAEDPVEISQHGLRQLQVNPKIGLTFAVAMRAFLRADPDVIMVGEIRDRETARIGIEASLTGHLVFSTLHTNSAPETVTRLVDMGMDPFNFADVMRGILAQRLVRTLCPQCRSGYHPTRQEYDHLRKIYGLGFDARIGTTYAENPRFFKAAGCVSCEAMGYRGRLGLYELLEGSDAIKQLIVDRSRADQIRAQAASEGMATLLQEGIRHVFSGDTDFHQVMTVCSQ